MPGNYRAVSIHGTVVIDENIRHVGRQMKFVLQSKVRDLSARDLITINN